MWRHTEKSIYAWDQSSAVRETCFFFLSQHVLSVLSLLALPNLCEHSLESGFSAWWRTWDSQWYEMKLCLLSSDKASPMLYIAVHFGFVTEIWTKIVPAHAIRLHEADRIEKMPYKTWRESGFYTVYSSFRVSGKSVHSACPSCNNVYFFLYMRDLILAYWRQKVTWSLQLKTIR